MKSQGMRAFYNVTRLDLGGRDLGLESIVDSLHEHIRGNPVLALHVRAVDAQR